MQGSNSDFGFDVAPFGFGLGSNKKVVALDLLLGAKGYLGQREHHQRPGHRDRRYAEARGVEEVHAEDAGDALALYGRSVHGEPEYAHTPSNTPGNPSSKTAILPNPNLGGFTASNPPSALPKAPTEEKFGQRMYAPSPYGEAFVTSQTLDVYQQTLVQTNTVYGFVRIPDPQIPRDINIVSFRMSNKYLRPGMPRRRRRICLQPGDLAGRSPDIRHHDRPDAGALRRQLRIRRRRPQRELHARRRGLPAQEADRPAGIQCPGALSERLEHPGKPNRLEPAPRPRFLQ